MKINHILEIKFKTRNQVMPRGHEMRWEKILVFVYNIIFYIKPRKFSHGKLLDRSLMEKYIS